MPTFLFTLHTDNSELPFIASVAIVDPITFGFRGVIRRFPDALAVREALQSAGIEDIRYASVVDRASDEKTNSFEIDLNEAQKLSLIQLDSTE